MSQSGQAPAKNGGRGHSGSETDPLDAILSSSYYYPPEEGNRIYRPSSLDMLSEGHDGPGASRASKEVTVRRQRSYARDVSRDVRSYYYYGNKGQYELNPSLFGDTEGKSLPIAFLFRIDTTKRSCWVGWLVDS